MMRIHCQYKNQLYIGTFNESALKADFVSVFVRDYGTIEIASRILKRHIESNLIYFIPIAPKKTPNVRAKINHNSHHDFMKVVSIDLECSVKGIFE